MKFRKIISCLLIIAIAAGVLCSCGGISEKQTSFKIEPGNPFKNLTVDMIEKIEVYSLEASRFKQFDAEQSSGFKVAFAEVKSAEAERDVLNQDEVEGTVEVLQDLTTYSVKTQVFKKYAHDYRQMRITFVGGQVMDIACSGNYLIFKESVGADYSYPYTPQEEVLDSYYAYAVDTKNSGRVGSWFVELTRKRYRDPTFDLPVGDNWLLLWNEELVCY